MIELQELKWWQPQQSGPLIVTLGVSRGHILICVVSVVSCISLVQRVKLSVSSALSAAWFVSTATEVVVFFKESLYCVNVSGSVRLQCFRLHTDNWADQGQCAALQKRYSSLFASLHYITVHRHLPSKKSCKLFFLLTSCLHFFLSLWHLSKSHVKVDETQLSLIIFSMV